MKKIIIVFTFLLAHLSNAQNVLTINKLLELNRLSGGTVSPDETKVLFEIKQANIEEDKVYGNAYIYDLKNKKYAAITDNEKTVRFDFQWTNDNSIWYISNEKNGFQVWNMDASGNNKRQITNEENGIDGFKISDDGSLLVLILDEKITKNVSDLYPELKKNRARIYDDLMYRHWNYWNDENFKQLYVVRLNNKVTEGSKTAIAPVSAIDKVNPPFSGSESIAVSPDNKTIYYSMKNKIGKDFALSTNTDIYAYDIDTKQTNNLSVTNKGYDNAPVVSKDGKYVAWLQMKNEGYESDKNDIILYQPATQKYVNLTEGEDITVSNFVIGDKKIYFIAPHKGCEQIFEIDLETKKLTQITTTIADYTGLALSKNSLIATRQSMIEPTDLFQIDLKSKKVQQLTNVNEAYLKTITKPTVKETWVKTTDGKEMLVWHVLPPNFDSIKAYPALLYCQGGPQSMVSQFFSYRWNLMLMASQGYVVVAPNRRGLPGFGKEWNEAISKDWGGQSIRDYLSATDDAAAKPYVDKTRMGAVGASYGGYSVYFLAGVHEKRFKTFISHCGLFNLESWYGTTEELFFANWDNKGPYWLPENKEYYQKNSPHNYVQNWDTPIMVIHGELDFRVPVGEGLQAYQAARLKGLKSKLLLFSNEGHWVNSPQNAVIWHNEFYKWLEEDLKK